MNDQILISLLMTMLVILFVWGKWRYDAVSLVMLSVFVILGFISPTENSIENLSFTLDLVLSDGSKNTLSHSAPSKLESSYELLFSEKNENCEDTCNSRSTKGLKANLEAATKLNRNKLLCVRALRKFGINTSLSDIRNIQDILNQRNNEAGCSAQDLITGPRGGYNSNSVNLTFKDRNIRSVCVCK